VGRPGLPNSVVPTAKEPVAGACRDHLRRPSLRVCGHTPFGLWRISPVIAFFQGESRPQGGAVVPEHR